jgi:hypothetical protein
MEAVILPPAMSPKMSPSAFFDINVTGIAVGQSVVVTLTLHTGDAPNA